MSTAKAKASSSKASVDLAADVKAVVAAAVEKAMRTPEVLKALSSVLVELVGPQLKDRMNFNIDLIADLRQKLEAKNKEVADLKQQLEDKTDQLEMYTRRNSFRVFGMAESEREDTDELVLSVAKMISIPLDLVDIDRNHSVCRKIPGKNRPIIVKFVSYRKRREMFQAKRKLKNKGITIREDLTKARLELLQAAIQRFGLANTWTDDGTIIVKKCNNRLRLQTFADLANIK